MQHPTNKSSKRGSHQVLLNGELTRRNIGEVRETLATALAAEKPLRIDVSQVRVADTAGIQLLIAFLQTAKARSLTTTWDGVSMPVQETARLLGLAHWLPGDIAPPASH